MIAKLSETFANQTRSLEILYLINDIKNAVRLDANELELRKIKDFCKNKKLFLDVSDFKVVKTVDIGKGTYSNIVKKVPSHHSEQGLHHIYISKDRNKAKFLKILENKNDDEAVGELLGYPNCCVDFFIKNKEKQEKLQNDYILPALANSNNFKFPFYNNHAIRYFDVTLLSHFPHNFECKESMKIAKNNLECIKTHSTELANKFENMLKSPVLYTENNGVFIFKNHKLNENFLKFDEVLSTTNNELLNELNQNKKIEIIDKNKIKINDRILDEVGFMLFTS